MRVLVIAPVSSDAMHVGGGVAVTYKVLSQKLRARGHHVEILSSWNGSLDHAFVRLHPGFRMIKASLKNLQTIVEGIKRADVVICPDSIMVPCIGLECWRFGAPSIWVMHTNFMAIGKHVLNALLYKFYEVASTFFMSSYGAAFTHILTTSRDYKEMLCQHGFGVSAYIDQGFKADVFKLDDDPDEIAAIRHRITRGNKDMCVMLYAGRFSPEKRIELLFDCIPDGFLLVLVGDGNLRPNFLEHEREDPRIVVVAEMLGQHDLRKYYKAADVTVSASDFETFGMTVHESLLCHTPVVVQNANGFRSQVRHGINGFLTDFERPDVAKRDIVKAMAYKFDVRPFRPDDCVDLVEFVEETSKKRKAPVKMHISWLITVLQMLYFVPASLSQLLFNDTRPQKDW